jgi:four helix bundle protein
MKKFRYLEWEVYKDAKELFFLILKLVKNLTKEFRFELGSQLIRSAFSIILNIAEGCGKTSDRELNRFINISLGSVSELLAAIDVLKDGKFITQEEFNRIFKKLNSISNQVGEFKKKLKSHKS